MKKIIFLLAIVLGAIAITSCRDNDSYDKQLKRERKSINTFIVKHGINVISEAQFEKQGNKTDVSKNQYVLFNNSGVYMQIVNEGTGEKLKNGETATVLCRFDETNVQGDTLMLSNRNLRWDGIVDKMLVTRTSGTFTASFDKSSSLMAQTYKSESVVSATTLHKTGSHNKRYRPVSTRALNCSIGTRTKLCKQRGACMCIRHNFPKRSVTTKKQQTRHDYTHVVVALNLYRI